MDKKQQKETINSAKDIADKTYDVSDYKSNDERDQGMAITHEQASDSYMEGTIDGKIDSVDKNNKLKGHEGEEIPREKF